MRHREWGPTEAWFCPCGFSNPPPPPTPKEPPSTRGKRERGLRYQSLYYYSGTSPGAQPQAQQLQAQQLLLVDFIMGCQAHLYHQRQVLLEVDGIIFIDIQLPEPGVCTLFLSRWRRKKQSVKIGVAIYPGQQGGQWPPASSEPGREPGDTQPHLTFMY